MKPAYRKLTPHGKFQNSRNVIICVLDKPLAPPTTVKKSRIVRYTLHNSAVKFDGRVLFPCAYVTVCDFLGFVEYLFLKIFTIIFPLYGTSNYYTTWYKKATKSPSWTSSLISQNMIFSGSICAKYFRHFNFVPSSSLLHFIIILQHFVPSSGKRTRSVGPGGEYRSIRYTKIFGNSNRTFWRNETSCKFLHAATTASTETWNGRNQTT